MPLPPGWKPADRRKYRRPADPLPPLTDLPTRSPYPTYAEMLKQAQTLAATSQAGAKTAYETQQKTLTDLASRRAGQQQQIAAALAEVLKGISPQVQGAFDASANSTAAFGKGFSDGMRLATQGSADESNAYLKSIGAPEGQMIPKSQSEQASNVLYGTGGYIPAQSFSQQGAALAGAAAGFPMQAAVQGNQLASAELAKGAEQAQQISDQLLALAAEQPALVQSYLEKLQNARKAQISDAEARAIADYDLAATGCYPGRRKTYPAGGAGAGGTGAGSGGGTLTSNRNPCSSM